MVLIVGFGVLPPKLEVKFRLTTACLFVVVASSDKPS